MRRAVAGKARVHELAKELGVTSKDVLAKLKDLGEFVKSASSTVEAPVARRLRDAYPKDGAAKGGPKGAPRPKGGPPQGRPQRPPPPQAGGPPAGPGGPRRAGPTGRPEAGTQAGREARPGPERTRAGGPATGRGQGGNGD